MRSIGKIKMRKLATIISEEVKRNTRNGTFNIDFVRAAVELRIPEDWYNTWESAHSEIERLISDTLFALYYRR